MRPPRIFKFRGKRFAILGGTPVQINSPLGDENFTKEIQSGYETDSDDEYYDQVKKVEIPENYNPLNHKGMYDYEINHVAKKLGMDKHGYLGVFPINKIHLIANMVNPGIEKFGFIFNTDPDYKSGQHWIAVCYIKKFKELDYYNSLGEGPTDEFLKQIKPVIDKLALPYVLKFKVNTIARQGLSYNCGYHSLMFLYRMLVLGDKYKFASGYSLIRNGENDVNHFKKTLQKFGYI